MYEPRPPVCERNSALKSWLGDAASLDASPPPSPDDLSDEEREQAEDAWWTFWWPLFAVI